VYLKLSRVKRADYAHFTPPEGQSELSGCYNIFAFFSEFITAICFFNISESYLTSA